MEAVKKQLVYCYRMIKDGYDLMVPYHSINYPVIFASMAMKGCVESGKSVQEGGAKYTTAGMFITGAANLGDSLTAIEDLVYNKKKISMDELIACLLYTSTIDADDDRFDSIMDQVVSECRKVEPDCTILRLSLIHICGCDFASATDGGRYRDRTYDILLVRQTLSQLS